jgi:hypothetical protein
LKRFASIVLMDVILFQQSHSNLVVNFHVLKIMDFVIVHHFQQFVFLVQLKRFASIVSMNVILFQQSHLNLILNFHILEAMHFLNVHHFQ